MFEITKKESSNKTIRMPNELIEKIEAVAGSRDVSFNRVVVQCCEYALKHLDEDNTGKRGRGRV